MMELREEMDVANRVRFYLRRVTDYAMHDFEPVRYMHIEAEVPALAEILRREEKYPWHVVGVELVEERETLTAAVMAWEEYRNAARLSSSLRAPGGDKS